MSNELTRNNARATSIALASLIGGALLLSSACQHLPGGPKPARLYSPERATQQELQQLVSRALGSNVVLSSRALTNSSQLIVDQPVAKSVNGHQQGLELRRPDHFTLWKQGEHCLLKHEQSERQWPLTTARCVAEQ